MSLILTKIRDIQVETERNIKLNTKKLATIKSISALLSQIDFSVEEVPFKDSEKLLKLFISLKGEKLSNKEQAVIKDIVEK